MARVSGSSGGYAPAISVTTRVEKQRQVLDVEKVQAFQKQKEKEIEQKRFETEKRISLAEEIRQRQELARRKTFVGKGRVIERGASAFTGTRTTTRKIGFQKDITGFKKTAFEESQKAYEDYNKAIEQANKELMEYKPMKTETYFEDKTFNMSGSGTPPKEIEKIAAEKGILVIKEKTPSGYQIKDYDEFVEKVLSTPTPYPQDNFGARQQGYALYPEVRASFGFTPQTFEYDIGGGQRVASVGSPIKSPSINLRISEPSLQPLFENQDVARITQRQLDTTVFEQGKQLALSSGFIEQTRIGRELEFAAIKEAGGKLGSLATEDFGLYSEKERKAIEAQARQEEERLKRLQEQDFAFRQARADLERRAETTNISESEYEARFKTLEMQYSGLAFEQEKFSEGFASRKAYQDYLKGLSREEKAYFGEATFQTPFFSGISEGRRVQTEIDFAALPSQKAVAGKEPGFLTNLQELAAIPQNLEFVGEQVNVSPFVSQSEFLSPQFKEALTFRQPIYEASFAKEPIRDLEAPTSLEEQFEFRQAFGRRQAIKAATRPYGLEEFYEDVGIVGFDVASGTVIGAGFGALGGGPAGALIGAKIGAVGGLVGGVTDVLTGESLIRIGASESAAQTGGMLAGIGAGFVSGATLEKELARYLTSGKRIPLSRIRQAEEAFPQVRGGTPELFEQLYGGKAQKVFRQEFDFLTEGKPLAIRTTLQQTDLQKIPKLAQYEELGAFYGPDVSMIGLPQFSGKQARRFTLFGTPGTDKGLIEVLEPKGLKRLPTTRVAGNISKQEYLELSRFTGIDLTKLPKTRISQETGQQIFESEFYLGIKKGRRPLKLRELDFLTGSREETAKAFVRTQAEPGFLYPSRAFQLGATREAEVIQFADPDLFLQRIGARGIRQRFLGGPTGLATEGLESAGIRFYKPVTKAELEKLPFLQKTEVKLQTALAKQQRKAAASYLRDYYSGFTRTPVLTPGRLVGLSSARKIFDYSVPRQSYKAPRYDFRVPREFRQTTPRYTQTSYSDLPRMPTQREVSFRDFGYTPTRTPTYRLPKEPTYRDVPYYPPTRTPTYRPPREPTLRTPPMTPPTRPPTKKGKKEEARIDYAQGSYHAFVRRDNNSKWVKATKQPLPYNAAFNQGLMVADNTVARSVKLKRVSKTYSGMDDPFIAEQKFRRRATRSKVPGEEIIFVEKNPFLIDTIGEKQGLKAAKYLKQKGGGFNWDFLKF